MHYKTGKLLNDIRKRCLLLTDIRDRTTLERFQHDQILHSAAERYFHIIGEATGRLRRLDPDTASRIVGSDQIVGLRNLIAHGYDDDITLSKLWAYMTQNIPDLLVQTEALLTEYVDEFGSDAEAEVEEPH